MKQPWQSVRLDSHLWFIVCIAQIIYLVNGAGFDYPAAMPPPLIAQVSFIVPHGQFLDSINIETPIRARIGDGDYITWWNCIAIYHPTALNFLTGERPFINVSSDIVNNYSNSETYLLCGAYAVTIYFDYVLNSKTTPALVDVFDQFGLNSSIAGKMDDDVLNCGIDDIDCLQDVAEANGFIPEIMGSIVALEIINYVRNDGWNQEGTLGKDGTACTANCRAYGDTTNYKPKINNPKRWAPLIEDNGFGFFYHYDHVVPHIGLTAELKIISRSELESKSAPNPKYNYKTEVDLVLDRLKDLATNDTAKMLVEFFDNKVSVFNTVLFTLQLALDWTFEERALFIVGYESSQYTAIVQSWLEKRRWDLIRPTTRIKRKRKNDILETYGGPFKGVQQIKGKDFESYIRVMPHSEYPSGSGCICKVVQEFVDKYLEERHGITDSMIIPLPLPFPGANFFAAGSSKIEPGVTPQNDLYISMSTMTELSDNCAQSRLWGGMHFTKSITAAQQLCDGIGLKGYEYINSLLNGQPL